MVNITAIVRPNKTAFIKNKGCFCSAQIYTGSNGIYKHIRGKITVQGVKTFKHKFERAKIRALFIHETI